MKTIMSRNAKGEVKFGKKSCKIPQDNSMLSVLGSNWLVAGGTYAKDGWIYKGKKKIKKWFTNYDRTKIWEPILDNLPALELRYQKMLDYRDKIHATVFSPAFNALDKVGKAHAKPTHKYTGDQQWWIWEISNDSGYGKGYGFRWVETPEKPLHHKIGQKFYEADRRMMEVYGRVGRFRDILGKAIDNYLWKNHKPVIKDAGRTMKLVINDRIYWYTCVFRHVPVWVKVNWPDEEMKTVELK